MSKKFEDSEITKEFAERIWEGSKFFAEGIYVPSDAHPCGWDFIDLSDIECSDDVDSVEMCPADISNGYGSEEFCDKTLLEILKIVHGQVAFEKSQIDWD